MLAPAISAIEALIRLVERRELASRRLFESHVQPLFEQLTKVHEGYVTIFQRVSVLLQDEARSTSDILAAITGEARVFSHVRILVGHLAAALRFAGGGYPTPSRRVRQPSRQRLVNRAAMDFARAVHQYFILTSGEPLEKNGTRIAGLLDLMHAYKQGDATRQDVSNWVAAVNADLPEHWRLISRRYVGLRLMCLS